MVCVCPWFIKAKTNLCGQQTNLFLDIEAQADSSDEEDTFNDDEEGENFVLDNEVARDDDEEERISNNGLAGPSPSHFPYSSTPSRQEEPAIFGRVTQRFEFIPNSSQSETPRERQNLLLIDEIPFSELHDSLPETFSFMDLVSLRYHSAIPSDRVYLSSETGPRRKPNNPPRSFPKPPTPTQDDLDSYHEKLKSGEIRPSKRIVTNSALYSTSWVPVPYKVVETDPNTGNSKTVMAPRLRDTRGLIGSEDLHLRDNPAKSLRRSWVSWATGKRKVPFERFNPRQLAPGEWVQVIKGTYAGDAALVYRDDIARTGEAGYTVLIVPRLPPLHEMDQKSKKAKAGPNISCPLV